MAVTESRTNTTGLRAFVQLTRPHFLIGGFVMFLLGALTAPALSLVPYLIGQFSITMAQLTAQYLNEYADYEADKTVAHRTAFSGGSGVLVRGALPRRLALRAGQITSMLALVGCIELLEVSLWASLTVLLALAISWAYSMPPVRLLGTGWGEAATAVAVAVLVPLTGALVHTESIAPSLYWMMAALAALQITMLLTFELPDLDTDAAAGKRVLGTRLGARNTERVTMLCLVIAVIVTVAGMVIGPLPTETLLWCLPAVAPAAALPVVIGRQEHARVTLCGVATFFLCGVGFVAMAL